jgi:hypothetical protein
MKKYILSHKTLLLSCLVLLIFSAFIRWLYYIHAPGIWVNEDTYSYFEEGAIMIKNRIPVGVYRTPVYSLFIHLVMFLYGKPEAPILSWDFFKAMEYTFYIQSILGVLSILILFKSLLILKLKPLYSFLFSLFTAFNIIVFSWDRLLLTESFAVFMLIVNLFFLVRIIRTPKIMDFIFLFILFILTVMLRPIYIAFPVLPLIVLTVYYFRQKNLRPIIYIFIMLILYFLILFSYFRENYRLNKVFGLSWASDITVFGKILSFDLPIENAKSEKFFYDLVTDYRNKNLEKNPFRFLEYANLVYAPLQPKQQQMKAFNGKVLASSYPQYFIKSLFLIPQALTETSEKIVLMAPSKSPASRIFNVLFQVYKTLQYLFFLIIPFTLISLYLFLKKSSRENTVLLILSFISLYQIIFAVLFGYAEFGRLICPAQPLMYLFIFLCIKPIFKPKINH